MPDHRANAFTLIETIFVVTLIASVGAFAITSWSSVPEAARFKQDVAAVLDFDQRCRSLARIEGPIKASFHDHQLTASCIDSGENFARVELHADLGWTVDQEQTTTISYTCTGRCPDYRVSLSTADRSVAYLINGATGWVAPHESEQLAGGAP